MDGKERRVRCKAQAVERILATAEDLFVARGFENVSLRDLAEKNGTSHTLVYKYFEGKSQILNEILQRSQDKLSALFAKAVAKSSSGPHKKMLGLLRAMIDFSLLYPGHFKLWLRHASLQQREKVMIIATQGRRFQAFQTWIQVLAECQAAGRLRYDDVHLTFQLLWSCVHGITSLIVTYPDYPWKPRRKLIDTCLDAVSRGYFISPKRRYKNSKE